MVFWQTTQPADAPANAVMDHNEEMTTDLDEPPEGNRNVEAPWVPTKLTDAHIKAASRQQLYQRRESLLTRQLHSETEHSDEDHVRPPNRALSAHSIWSNQSTTSTAELTSDDGHSVPSPTVSPPLPPTKTYNAIPFHDKPLDSKVKIVGQEGVAQPATKATEGSEKVVEATLGRKRCIMFACRGKEERKAKETVDPPAVPSPAKEEETSASPPKRKCTIKFACPSRSMKQALESAKTRHMSPPPPQRTNSSQKVHRGSDATVTHASPKSSRKSPNVTTTAPTPTADTPRPTTTRKVSNDSDEDAATDAMRFHEFASSEGESEEWMHESSCHRSRLTIDDTLKKEIVIRKACEEVEEEVLEEEDDEDVDADEDEGEVDEEDDDEDDMLDTTEEVSDHSDAGFHSDDEEGFAASDSEDGDSDYEWWKPGGSTAATSIEHLDRLHISKQVDADALASSMNSISSGEMSPRAKRKLHRRARGHARSQAIPINNNATLAVDDEEELPDSTDFVCGTLDEDRPMEQAYIDRKKEHDAAKHKARPQDIDPTFPTSDPEMDEEDDDDLVDGSDESEPENMVHGDMDELEDEHTLKRRPSPRPRGRPNHSPAPTARYHSPPPSKKPSAKHHSPPPSRKQSTKHHSPPPAVSRRSSVRSPPPQRKLFGHSPRRNKSTAPGIRMTSPPNSRQESLTPANAFIKSSQALAERPQLTHTASLPRGGFLLSRMGSTVHEDRDGSDTVGNDVPKRGAIDIVKGLEKKRQRRKEKVWQKMCAKAAAKSEKAYKVKPGKGAERMREVGLQLQEYHGKAQHILSL